MQPAMVVVRWNMRMRITIGVWRSRLEGKRRREALARIIHEPG
jgi:hypothetical protein